MCRSRAAGMEELFLSFLLPLVLVHDYLFSISDFSPITGQKPGFYTSSQRGSRIITSRVILEPESPVVPTQYHGPPNLIVVGRQSPSRTSKGSKVSWGLPCARDTNCLLTFWDQPILPWIPHNTEDYEHCSFRLWRYSLYMFCLEGLGLFPTKLDAEHAMGA